MENAVVSKPSNRRSSLTNVYESLDATHRAIVHHLERLKGLATLLVTTTPTNETARDQVREVIEFFSGASREHHYDEERFAFPKLLAGSDATVHRVVERLREDHAWIELQWLDIEAQLETSAEGMPPNEGQAFIAAVDDFALLMYDHMALEESTFHPELRARVAADKP
jgi:hemerythrin-like domain-containing protein